MRAGRAGTRRRRCSRLASGQGRKQVCAAPQPAFNDGAVADIAEVVPPHDEGVDESGCGDHDGDRQPDQSQAEVRVEETRNARGYEPADRQPEEHGEGDEPEAASARYWREVWVEHLLRLAENNTFPAPDRESLAARLEHA